ncbi:unnamed protein product [Cylicocyclus nassatus]|uniref:Uncharacterized protein n=1 Tax=Cylicocyclus nassatus TaxID=53992 RepID=A0AA36M338_CYLNA|nr:unnamed protein product [Cylicocyclus nassatus]
MLKKEYRQLSCYKIMTALGFYDMAAIAINSLATGLLWLNGANYCSHPTLVYVLGTIGLSLWCGACLNCLILVINRILEVTDRRWLYIIYGNHRTYVVLLLPFIYSVCFCFFTPPMLFNSSYMAWFFDTYAPGHEADEYYNYPYTVNNLLVVAITCLLYIPYARRVLSLSRSTMRLSWAQKSFFIQCTSICTANFVAALSYVYMQFFETTSYIALLGHIFWQLGHGFPAIVYIVLNKTIHREALYLLGIRRPSNSTQVTQVSKISRNTTQNSHELFHG